MTLHLHHAPTTGLLAEALGALLAEPLPDPFAEEVVVVPAKGVERWLTQRLSHRLGAGESGDGVCAGVRFLNPRSLVALLTGTERDDPWDPDRLVWPLLEVVDASLDEPWCRTLAVHLGHLGDTAPADLGLDPDQVELRRDRRWSVVRRLAGLYAAYAVQRPQLLADWREGCDTDGAPGGTDLPDDLVWQPALWRRLLERVDAPSPDVRHRRTLEAIRAGEPLELPDRLSMFGHTRMPVTELELLRAVGEVREVHLWLPQPSPTGWRTLAPAVAEGPVRRRADGSGRLLTHPLLSSLGRDSRELQRSLAVLGPVQTHDVQPAAGRADGDEPTLLRMLQADLRADRHPPTGRVLRPDDRSVQVHSCHGPTRQVEVLREVLVGLMEDDPTLEPRDILVMCPDVEAYAPLFSASFGLVGDDGSSDLHPAHRLRVRLADRGLRGVNPLLALAGRLVELAGGRATASEVLDLTSADPVRHRFRLDDDELATVTSWVEQSGVRWGLSADLRDTYRLDDLPHNTWRAGLDRVLLGVAMADDDGLLGDAVPLDDVGSQAVDLAGRLAELVDRVETAVRRLRAARDLDDWVEALRDGVLGLGSVPVADQWQVTQLERELDGLLEAAGGRGTPLRLADVRTLLEHRLQPRPTRANFRTGHLTVATLVPMRSVPHRVVCLVGLDDGVFPRSSITDGDDVLARDPMTGERDARAEDRQLLLDAVLAAEETLVVTYTGANVHSGQDRPPAVPLGELLDALERTVPGGREHARVAHPLQPFDPRNFAAGAPFSFDRPALAAAVATTRPRVPAPRLLDDLPLAAAPPADVALADLQAFYAHPVRSFLRQRLDLGLPQEYDEVADALPVELDALQTWGVGDRLMRAALAGRDPAAVKAAERRRGALPPKALGEHVLNDIGQRVGALLGVTDSYRQAEPRSVEVTVDLGGGRRLTGVVPDVRRNRIVRVHYSNLGAKHRFRSWIDLLALSAGLPDQSWTASTFGWHPTGIPQHALVRPLDDTATALLRDLVELHDRGLREPLPMPPRTAYAWADAVRAHKQPLWTARGRWESSDRFPGEADDPAHVRVYGRRCPFETLIEPPRPDEQWPDGPGRGESTRLGRYALRMWQPLFDHERVEPA